MIDKLLSAAKIVGKLAVLILLLSILVNSSGCGWPFTCAPASTLIATCGKVHPIGPNPHPSAYVPPRSREVQK